jgi:hypothetical protein
MGRFLSIIIDPINTATRKYNTQYPNIQLFNPKIKDKNLLNTKTINTVLVERPG